MSLEDIKDSLGRPMDVKTVIAICAAVVAVTLYVSGINERQSLNERDYAMLDRTVTTLSTEINGVKADVSALQSDVSTMDRRQIQYHRALVDKLEQILANGSGSVTWDDMPDPGGR